MGRLGAPSHQNPTPATPAVSPAELPKPCCPTPRNSPAGARCYGGVLPAGALTTGCSGLKPHVHGAAGRLSRRSQSRPSYPRQLPPATLLAGRAGAAAAQSHGGCGGVLGAAPGGVWWRAGRSVVKIRSPDLVWGFATFELERSAPPAPGGPNPKNKVEGI